MATAVYYVVTTYRRMIDQLEGGGGVGVGAPGYLAYFSSIARLISGNGIPAS
jgi:hypothetical protein